MLSAITLARRELAIGVRANNHLHSDTLSAGIHLFELVLFGSR